MSNSLQPHGLHHSRPPCPSPTPRACSNSCPLSWWCHPTILPSVVLFSSFLQSFPASGSFPMRQFFSLGDQSIRVSALASVLPIYIQDWFPLGWTGWISLQSKGLSRVFFQHHSSKASILRCSAFLMVQLSHPYMTIGKTITLTRQTFISKLMSLLFNMLSFSRFSSKEQVSFNFMAVVTICSDFGAPQNKICHCFHCFPVYLPRMMRPDAMILVFWILSSNWTFSLSSSTFIKRLFSFSLLSAIRVVSSAYLRLLIFLLEILIPACASSSLAFHMMQSAYKLNKQDDNIQPWCATFPIWNQSNVPCPVLTVASWPAYRFLRRQVRWSGIPISKNFPQFVVIHTVKGFGIINKAGSSSGIPLLFLGSSGWWQFNFWFLCLF